MLPRCTVKVKINGLSSEQSTSIKRALEPDNIKMPKGLEIVIKDDNHTENKRSIATTTVATELWIEFSQIISSGIKKRERKETQYAMGHLIGTVDEVLEHVQVALKVIDDD